MSLVAVAKGQVFSLCYYVISIILIMVSIITSRSRSEYRVRNIAGIDAITEALGRATELGKPVHFSPGRGLLTGPQAAQTLSGLSVLNYVSTLAARYQVELIVSVAVPEVLPIAVDIVKQAYANEGHADLYQPDTVRFISNSQWASAAAVVDICQRENVAANILTGFFDGDSLILSEGGQESGRIQIAGTAMISQIPYFAASCDYTLIGEELFVAGAVLSGDKTQLGSIRGQDLCRALVWGLAAIGAITATFGSTFISDLIAK